MNATFIAGAAGMEPTGILQFDYEFINTIGDDQTSRMGFQAYLGLDGPGGGGVSFVADLGAAGSGLEVGHSGSVRMNTGVMAAGDELTLVAISNLFTPGQGVALYNARIVVAN